MRKLIIAAILLVTALPGSADDPTAKRSLAQSPVFVYSPRCTEKQCQQLRRGMSIEEAQAILGCPPGDYTGGRGMYVCFIDPFPASNFHWNYKIFWCGEQGAIGVTLNNGRVNSADWYPALYSR
jgi:hypothetical protein